MESFDDLVKRQQNEYSNLLEHQRDVWALLQQRGGGHVTPEVAITFNQQAAADLNNLAKAHNSQREANPQYSLIMAGNRQLEMAEQVARHEIEEISKEKQKEEEMDIFLKMIENQKMLERRQAQDQGQSM